MHLLVESRSAFIKRNRKGVVLPFIITAPGGKDGPAITEQIQHGVFFRHPQGLVAGQEHSGGRQTEAARFRRQVDEKNRRRGQTAEKTEVMLGHPHRVKPQFFRQEAFGVDVI